MQDTTDGCSVGEHERCNIERYDGVEGGRGADIDKCQDGTDEAGQPDRIDRDLPRRMDGGDPCPEEGIETAVLREGVRLSGGGGVEEDVACDDGQQDEAGECVYLVRVVVVVDGLSEDVG